ncbi:C-X-C chemokine receptor type 1 [Toxocara canis]|uniref:C-X-C chemokine receptor type 1 n=1 Tax=Toxocara canis TaxID=6265 RepID=A0A0B2VFC7_TOXCA|nr:C-X-C chemokine receptor type 1 [Toxocara canis]
MDVTGDCSIAFSLGNAVLSITFTVIFCLSALGNSIVIITILKRQKRSVRSITNLYLLNLSVADLLSGV